MFPNIHDNYRIKARRNAVLVQRDPVIRKLLCLWIPIEDRPANAAHSADRRETLLPHREITEIFFQRLFQITGGIAGPFRRQVFEVILVEYHPSVLKTQAPCEFGILGIVSRDLAFKRDLFQFLQQQVGIFHIALVEAKVHLQGFIGNPREAG